MAARLCCQLDTARDVLCLRPVGAESRGRPFSGSVGALPPSSPPAVPADHGAHLSLRGLPVCAFSSAGPCALRFTSARCMETTVNAPRNLPKVLHKRTLGLSTMSTTGIETYFKDCVFKDWEELGEEIRLKVFVLGGCRHKLVCSPAPCNFFTSA
uniref:Protein X n=1 Tax=Orangutan hepatitis B virus (isolate Somad) TaxID=489545 RepID=X_HBVOR|nr:RecName: Full=Protein X; AltName: Full=HBx; AltName: Full=Peptide X; AltName: Full=pX [Hepatitis B virus Orangutan/Somad]AAF33118.1 X protein [Orangutan hepadnavirus]